MSQSDNHIRVGISCGDLNGIGMEVVIKAFADPAMLELCTPVLFGSSKSLSYHRKAINAHDFKFNTVEQAIDAVDGKFNVVESWSELVNLELGKEDPLVGDYAYKSLEIASEALKKGHVDVLVTAPVNKNNIANEERVFTGHTEFLGEYFKGEPLMILAGDQLRVGLVTGHIPLKNVAKSISSEKVVVKLRQLNDALVQDFGISKPKIAVLGLNPHAGDGGLLGEEDQKIIEPAVRTAFDKGIVAMGPFSSDGFFGSGEWKKYDAVLAMYHDQGLIPFKTIHFGEGVNFTANLSVIRTSPDHGTAYDLAGKGTADEQSFRQAVYMAIDAFRHRSQHLEITANPLAFGKTQRDHR
ncbi:MAG: 4-hydroxythreonine-4-phosphate dehydrogenase PdxA [Bacteroidetes bacterium]|uniref:4-hydroxythreonine-4-phosphate dehydrogenase PdxA n=1 Tax=Phaeocystidibacter marisrubri TaxID=1577780 RepID=A0A6L3ZF46_9FLAO|nr:4-hydroxythreonine-4-phosphate dehydrogenase PdxA [Phaeocystidibacter marisrubri]KAB2816330.1 4-hydroxythreonine-4-phosphate dehydrogenase PdxA [Phaeocystidibacter marisrubri]TNE28183.1 MAG: 4-hydroxythreonine-4-phosphate dehydrogenase PdxA [Bacteroidota bacterium]GGH68487.1 4-hydroxythreonine-4-phosphate dehydrogenase [Phaeocystidibacter marisrubri]